MEYPKLYSRYEPTTDSILRMNTPKTTRLDIVLYFDRECQHVAERRDWNEKTVLNNFYRHVNYTFLKDNKDEVYRVEFLGWVFTPYTSVQSVRVNASGGCRVVVECGPRGWIDNPIKYNDGTIAYDFPERVSKKLKHYVKMMYSSHAFKGM